MRRTKLLIVISLSVVFLECFTVPIHCKNEKCSVKDSKSKTPKNWDDENKIKLLEIFHETDPGKWGHEKRMKAEWDRINGMKMPETARSLYSRALRWINIGKAEGLLSKEGRHFRKFEPRSKIKWTPGMKENIIKFYHESDPEEWRQSKRMKELWDKEYPHHREFQAQYLMKKVAEVLKQQGEGPHMKRINLTEEQKIHLLRCHHIALNYKREQMKMTRELFIKKYPQHANATYDILRHHISYFRRQHPEIEEKIMRRVSAPDTIHHSRSSKESPESRQEGLTTIPTFQSHDSRGVLEQNFDTNHLRSSEESLNSRGEGSTIIPTFQSHDSRGVLEQNFDKNHLRSSEESLNSRGEGSTTIPTFQNHDYHGILEQHFNTNHSRELGEASGSRQEESTNIATSQSHDSHGLSREYSNLSHSIPSGELSRSNREKSTSISTLQNHILPGASEQYFDPDRDNAWIDHMIQEASFSNLHDTTPAVDTKNQNKYPSNIWDHLGWDFEMYHSDKEQRGSSKRKQPAP